MASNGQNGATRWWHFPMGLAALALSILLAWLVARLLWHVFSGLQKEVAAALIAGSLTVIGSVATVMASRRYEQSKTVEQSIRERKLPVYEKFTSFWLEYMLAENLGKRRPSDKEFARFLASFTGDLLIWGSDDMLARWSRFRRQIVAAEESSPNRELLFEYERMFLAMRREFGHTNKGLKKGDLLGLFVNDIDEYIQSDDEVESAASHTLSK